MGKNYGDLWERCVKFHGHQCPGLAIGVRATQVAMEVLGESFSPDQDEDIVCITENDTCAVDGVQMISGCTLGKGNLIYRPTGKIAFSFFMRNKGKKVRIVLKPGIRDGLSRQAFQELLLTAPAESLFDIKTPTFEVPERARHFRDEVCELCKEAAPENKIRLQEGEKVCLDCLNEYTRGW